ISPTSADSRRRTRPRESWDEPNIGSRYRGAYPSKRENPRTYGGIVSTATGIRTRVSAVRGRRPSPLDDSGGGGGLTRAGGSLAARAASALRPAGRGRG